MTQPPNFEIRVPDDLEGGAYANILNIWHTAHEFTFDFGVTLPVTNPPTVPVRVTARVKVPPTVVFDIIRAVNSNLTKYESVFGPIRRPGDTDPLPFPEGLIPEDGDDNQDDDGGTD